MYIGVMDFNENMFDSFLVLKYGDYQLARSTPQILLLFSAVFSMALLATIFSWFYPFIDCPRDHDPRRWKN